MMSYNLQLMVPYAQFSLGIGELLVVEEADIDFSGSGELNADFSYPGDFSIGGGISGSNANIKMNRFLLGIPDALTIDITSFEISDATTFSIDCTGHSTSQEGTEIKFVGGIDTTWYIGTFLLGLGAGGDMFPVVEIEDFSGDGEISLGAVVSANVGRTPYPEYLILGIAGEFQWSNLNIAPGAERIETIGGFLSGSADVEIYLPLLLYESTDEFHLNGNIYETTTIDFSEVRGKDGAFTVAALTLQPGYFNFGWQITAIGKGNVLFENSGTVNPEFDLIRIQKNSKGIDWSLGDGNVVAPKFLIDLDVDGAGRDHFMLDTDDNACTVTLSVFNIMVINNLGFKSQDLKRSWDGGENSFFKNVEWNGTFTPIIGGTDIDIFYNGQWHSLDLSGAGGDDDLLVDHGGPYEGEAGEIITFSGSVSGGTPPYDYTWYTDGPVTGEQLKSGQTISYTFTEIGEYVLLLDVKDSLGNHPPYVETTVNVVMPHDNLPPNAILDAMDGNITKWRWEYGDGTAEEGDSMPTAYHEYDSPGAYDLKLWVYDDWDIGRSDTATVFVQSNENQPPEVYIYAYKKENGNFVGPVQTPDPNAVTNIYGGSVDVLYEFKHKRTDEGSWPEAHDPDGQIYQYKWELDMIHDNDPNSDLHTGDIVCFLAGTKIAMADGTQINIEDIEIGDMVKTYDEANKEVTVSRVTNTFHHTPEEMTDYYLIINGMIRVTPNHRLFINGEWKAVHDIKIGDKLLDINGNLVLITSIEKVFEKESTYNIEVETHHTYFANEILAHNEKDIPVTPWRNGNPNTFTLKWKKADPGEIDAHVVLRIRDDQGAESEARIAMQVYG